jgi:UDP-glucose 4-epimerase
MIILTGEEGETASGPTVLLMGLGLVGSAVLETLQLQSRWSTVQRLNLSWNNSTALAEELGSLERDLSGNANLLHVVWSAGTIGFQATVADCAVELESFRKVLTLAGALAHSHPVVFHMVSSGGGLFEGQRGVGRNSTPRPRRPYGELKLEQEKALISSGLAARIYRPGTIYGAICKSHRQGIISLFLLNGIRGTVCNVYGKPSTQRDYVWTGDIGHFIALEILRSREGVKIHHLVSGNPTSIFQIQQNIQRLLMRNLYVGYQRGHNDLDITFQTSICPVEWFPSDLSTGIHRIYNQWRGAGAQAYL